MSHFFLIQIKKRRFAIGLLLAVAFGITAFMFIRFNYYPIAFVGAEPISARRVVMNYQSALRYHQNLQNTYAPYAAAETPPSAELRASVLSSLVEAALIHRGVTREVGGSLKNLVRSKVEKYDRDQRFKLAAETLYGLRFADFKREVLVPQAEKDILSGRLFLKGEKFDEWLEEAKRSAPVLIFSTRFKWDGESVIMRD